MHLNHLLKVAVVITLVFAACGGNDAASPGMNPDTSTGVQLYGLNLVHASPDAPALDVYFNDKLMTTVDYRQSTGFLKANGSAQVKVDIRVAGAAATSAAILTTNVQVAADARVHLAIIGRLNAAVAADVSLGLRLVALLGANVDASVVKLRALHAAPSAPVLDLTANAKLVAKAVQYGDLSVHAALDADLALGSDLSVRLGGLDVDAALAKTLKLHARGSVLTAIVLGEAIPTSADNRFLSISILDELTGELVNLDLRINVQAGQGSLYLFHGIPDLPALDLAVQGNVALSAVAYQKASAILALNAGVYPVELRVAGSANAVLALNLKLLAGTHWTLSAAGFLQDRGRAELKLRLLAALRVAASADAQVRVANLVADSLQVDVKAGAEAWAKALVYGALSGYVKVAGALPLLNLNLDIAAKLHVLLDATIAADVALASQNRAVTLFITGAADASLGANVAVTAVIESDLTVKTPLLSMPLAMALHI